MYHCIAVNCPNLVTLSCAYTAITDDDFRFILTEFEQLRALEARDCKHLFLVQHDWSTLLSARRETLHLYVSATDGDYNFGRHDMLRVHVIVDEDDYPVFMPQYLYDTNALSTRHLKPDEVALVFG